MDFGWLWCINVGSSLVKKNVSYVNNGGGYAGIGAGDRWKFSIPSSQFCCKPKTAIKNFKYL